MKGKLLSRKGISLLVLALAGLWIILQAACSREAGSTVGDPWGSDRLVQPEELVEILSGPVTGRPLLLHIGVPDLFRRMHISGSTFVGMTSTPQGIQKLKETVEKLPLDTGIVIYCGCCPWDVCPNTRPAFTALQELGFTNVKVLYIPHNLQRDWAEKGYPTERGAGSANRRQE
jgi:thiosulfate/3-mercaptopyruvate sulfurtransferase